MSLYDTGNPVPSDDPRDFSDNTQILDLLLMMTTPTVDDRLGVARKTWWQIEQDALALVSPNITALAALVGAANKGFYFSGTSAMSTYDLAAQGRTFLAATTQAAQRAALQLVKTTGPTDTTAGSVLQVGDGGLLAAGAASLGAVLPTVGGSFILSSAGATAAGLPLAVTHSITYIPGGDGTAGHLFASPMTGTAANRNRLWHAQKNASAITAWEEFAYGGANSSITSLSGLTTALSIAQGGTGNTTGLAATATALATTRSISATGDATWTVNFNGTANATAALTLASVGTAGTYGSVTTDAKGRVTAGSVSTPVANGGTGGTSAATAGTNLGTSVVGTNTSQLAQSAMVQNEIANKRAWTAYTPTITASTGTFTAISATGKYMVAFGICHVQIAITVTTIGTGTKPIATLPFAALAGSQFMPLPASEQATNGKSGVAVITAGLLTVATRDYANGDLATANGSTIYINGSYPIA